jgi:calcium-dependent protein kinase
MLTGDPPFVGDDEDQIFNNIINSDPNFESEAWADISEQAKMIVSGLLEKDPLKRLSADQALSLQWFEEDE